MTSLMFIISTTGARKINGVAAATAENEAEEKSSRPDC